MARCRAISHLYLKIVPFRIPYKRHGTFDCQLKQFYKLPEQLSIEVFYQFLFHQL